MVPLEAASDGEVGYKTARSEADSDDSSHVGDGVEVEEPPDESTETQPQPEIEVGKLGGTIRKKTSRDAPAPVTPIGQLPRIPSIQPLNTNPRPISPPKDTHATPRKPPIYEVRKDHLVGKTIDEWGDIVDEDGQVLGRVEGDLPSMVGRKISNARGDILGDDGGLLGYVAEVGPEGNHQRFEEQQKSEEQQKPSEEIPTRSLDDVMKDMAAAGKGPGGLRVDLFGNILDADGNLVGSFHDKTTGFGRKSGAFPESDLSDNVSESKTRAKPKPRARAPESNPKPVSDKPEGTATERRDKAQAQKKEENPLNPSDIFLDVKSTTEGIQLTIRIPTVFSSGGAPLKPKIVFE
ncbi:unnamed protein product [Discula destructiva]